jgi:hypothetical protein
MARINHVKLVSPEPEAVDAFLREVAEIPAGFPLPAAERVPDPVTAAQSKPAAPGVVTLADVARARGADGSGGVIVGDEKSRQFQVLRGPDAHLWSVAIGIRDLEAAHRRARDRGLPVSDIDVVPFGAGQCVRYFFVRVGGLLFELMRVEKQA